MKNRDNVEVKSQDGFIFEDKASYKITNVEKPVLYEYNLYNSEILVKLNKFGINSVQYQPPGDVMLLNSNNVNNFSKWNVYVKQNDGVFINNFSFPRTIVPQKSEIIYKPDIATYKYTYEDYEIITEIFISNKNASVIMKTTIKNLLTVKSDFEVIVGVEPYLNPASLALWDKPEWYVQTGLRQSNGIIDFYSKLFNPQGDVSKRRLMTFSLESANVTNCCVDMTEYIGLGDFFHPYRVKKDFSIKTSEIKETFEQNIFQQGCPSVYALKLDFKLTPNESKTLSQVLSIQDKSFTGEMDFDSLNRSHGLLNESKQNETICLNKRVYSSLFNLREIKTDNKTFDYYVNGFLPLQLFWVCGLDRGWPTGMQGTRDSAVDFEGMTYFYPDKSRKQLLHLYSCMRSDGWSLRQISTLGKNGIHDERFYCDSTAFIQEFLYEYVCATSDFDILDEKISWLDNDTCTSLLDHYLKGFDFYLDEKNIGEHGLCKLYAGDWLDPINQAGLKGKGESVMVSCMLYYNLNNAMKLLTYLDSERYSEIIKNYHEKSIKIKISINKSAYNIKGFYNGMYTDGGFWIFSDCDPDKKERFYSAANYYAIMCGVADKNQVDSVLNKSEELKCSCGYRLFAPSFTEHIGYVGRVASGDMADGLWENGAVYNHGGNCFRARALAKARRADKLLETILYILPFDQNKHPIEISKGSPYGIVNCYQTLRHAFGKAGSPFLSGSVAMSVRIIYCDLFGINFDPENLILSPCLTKEFSKSTVKFKFRNKNITVKYIYGEGDSLVNNNLLQKTDDVFLIKKDILNEDNDILIYYK